MEITKQNLENLKENAYIRHVCSLFNIDLDKLVSDAMTELVRNENLKSTVEDNVDTSTNKKLYTAPTSKSNNFVMNLKLHFRYFLIYQYYYQYLII